MFHSKMWEENSKECEVDCQCSGLITESFTINSGNNGTKRRREAAISNNFKLKMHPHSLEFNHKSPLTESPVETPPKRRVFGEIQNSPRFLSPNVNQKSPVVRTPVKQLFSLGTPLKTSFFNSFSTNSNANTKSSPLNSNLQFLHRNSPVNHRNSPVNHRNSPVNHRNSPLKSLNSPKLNAPFLKRSTTKLTKVFEERTKFKMAANKENEMVNGETFMKIESIEETTTDSAFDDTSFSPARVLQKSKTIKNWSLAQLSSEKPERNFSLTTSRSPAASTSHEKAFQPEADPEFDSDFETLHDLDMEFECDNFESCNKYEIISTDSPDIISKGRESNRKITSRNFNFGAPIGDSETSTSFNTKPSANATRMLNFDDSYDFTSPLTTSAQKTTPKLSNLTGFDTNLSNFGTNVSFCPNLFESVPNLTESVPNLTETVPNLTATESSTKTSKLSIFERKFSSTSVSVKKSLKFNETPTKMTKLTKNPSSSSISSSSISSSSVSSSTLSSMQGSNLSLLSSPLSSNFNLYPSESTTSMESGFVSELEEPFLELDDQSNSPKMANFTELLSKPIKNSLTTKSSLTLNRQEFQLKRPLLSRSISFNPEMTTSSKVRTSLLTKLSENETNVRTSLTKLSENKTTVKTLLSKLPENETETKRCTKREPLSADLESSVVEFGAGRKRRKSGFDSFVVRNPERPKLQRALSENSASIMMAMAKAESNPDLIGDFSQPFALPLTRGIHNDLKAISSDTLARLLRGEYGDTCTSAQVIDCRYPYEFEGGHIIGAKNLYTPEQVLGLIHGAEQASDPSETSERRILVFHCEFSQERGPKLSRFLRSSDRAKNQENYPSLHYPEIYLLHEGYKGFYTKYMDLCTPQGYTPMSDPRFREHLVKFRRTNSVSKSFYL